MNAIESKANIWVTPYREINKIDAKDGMKVLREMFPDAEANERNFVLFSTSGPNGTYSTIEDIEQEADRYEDGKETPEWNYLTFVIMHPRILCLKYGNAIIEKDDIDFIKRLRKSSTEAIKGIGY